MEKKFKNVQIGDKLLVEYFVFPFTENEELIVTNLISYTNGRLKVECETKGGSRRWFETNENETEFHDSQSAYECTRITIL